MSNQKLLSAGDAEERKCLSIADDKIGEDRFRKLKFLTAPLLLSGGSLRDAETVVRIYEILTMQYEGDYKKAASELYAILGILGLKHFKNISDSHSSEIWDNEKFEWRVKLIEHSDKAVKLKRDSELIDRLFDSDGSEIDMNKESITSPLMLFEYMIDHDLLKPGEEEDLEKVKDAYTSTNKRCVKRTSVITTATIFLWLTTIGSLLSLLKFANFADLTHFRNIFFNGPVTVMVGEGFDLRYYSDVDVSITSTTAAQPPYMTSLCQAECDDILKTTLQIDFGGVINSSIDTRCYLPFPGFLIPAIPTLFMLEGSVMDFKFTPLQSVNKPLRVELHIFLNARECKEFNNQIEGVSPHQTLRLAQDGDFTGTYSTTSDDYVCVVVELDGEAFVDYRFAVNSTVIQYRNVSFLQEQDQCDKNVSKMLSLRPDGSGDSRLNISLELNRSLKSKPQPTCVLMSVQNALNGSVLNITSTISATDANIGLISVSVVGSMAFIACVIGVSLLLVCCIKRCL